MGGEKRLRIASMIGDSGSPPRGRGKGKRPGQRCNGKGITPAWAGKRQFYSPLPCLRRDHPRVGGEKVNRKEPRLTDLGSPPRGRGKVLPCPALPDVPGITPAWAGKSSSGRGLRWGCRDHPHTGGEKGTLPLLVCWWAGSPPRRRGKAEEPREPGTFDRITPAWAGKSSLSWPWGWWRRDHPRMGGEKKGFVCPSS